MKYIKIVTIILTLGLLFLVVKNNSIKSTYLSTNELFEIIDKEDGINLMARGSDKEWG